VYMDPSNRDCIAPSSAILGSAAIADDALRSCSGRLLRSVASPKFSVQLLMTTAPPISSTTAEAQGLLFQPGEHQPAGFAGL
jgi:hypothetical protein